MAALSKRGLKAGSGSMRPVKVRPSHAYGDAALGHLYSDAAKGWIILGKGRLKLSVPLAQPAVSG